jgi:hypothetical protein
MLATIVQAWTPAAPQVWDQREFENVTESLVQRPRPDRSMTIGAREERVLRLAFRDARREHLPTRTKAIRQIGTDGHEP